MKKYLWVYRELENSNPVFYNTFLSPEEAANLFKDKFAYARFDLSMITLGVLA